MSFIEITEPEYCASLMPPLNHLVDAVERILMLRTFFGGVEHIQLVDGVMRISYIVYAEREKA